MTAICVQPLASGGSNLKLLVSCATQAEAEAAIAGGADIVDVKNPKEGALGASFPWIIRQIHQTVNGKAEVSCTLGDLPNLPGSVSLAALGAAATGVDYVKVSLGSLKTREDSIFFLRSAAKAAKELNPHVKIVAVGYADSERTGSVSPQLVPEIADETNADVTMVDTCIKNGDNIFSFLGKNEIQRIVDDAHKRGLQAALAGSLRKEQLHDAFALKADIVGVRSAACTNNDRLNGTVTREAVEDLVRVVRGLQMR